MNSHKKDQSNANPQSTADTKSIANPQSTTDTQSTTNPQSTTDTQSTTNPQSTTDTQPTTNSNADTDALLAKLNEFTRRTHSLDEVYIFPLILCDNDIDRDFEAFSLESLKILQNMCIGVTGIFDHNPKGANQTARIFHAELVADNSRKTTFGAVYTALKAYAYMVKTSSNQDLIKEIDAGIKKEVSISCACESHICSICGADKKKKTCGHVKGKSYNNNICYVILQNITDVYEWSFVAVPAQVNAGVTKRYLQSNALPQAHPNTQPDAKSSAHTHPQAHPEHYLNADSKDLVSIQKQLIYKDELINLAAQSLKSDITKLLFLTGNQGFSTILSTSVEKMSIPELIELKKSLSLQQKGMPINQLPKPRNAHDSDDSSSFSFKN